MTDCPTRCPALPRSEPVRILALLGAFLTVVVAAPARACDTWSTEATPNLEGERCSLAAAAAFSPDDIWAVGRARSFTGSDFHSISMRWDGTAWSFVDVPCPAHPLTPECSLYGVAGVTSDDVWAVGQFMHPEEYDWEPLTMHWDGSAWEYVPTVTQPNGAGASYYAATAVASDDVWAVGEWPGSDPAFEQEPLAARWDGSSWEVHHVPYNTDGETFEDTALGAISAVSSDDIWAVGNHGIATVDHRPFIAHWDGSSWSVPATRPDPLYRGTRDVAAVGPDDVWISAVKSDGSLFGLVPVFLHWDGTSWTESESPGGSELTAVAPDDVWAVDAQAVSHWDGSGWTLVAQVEPFTENRIIADVVTVGPCEVRGVGWSGVANEVRTLAMSLSTGGATSVLPDVVDGGNGLFRGAFPNPFRPRTTLSWELPRPGHVRLTILDVTGRRIVELVDGPHPRGAHSVEWSGRDGTGSAVGAGVYFARFESEETAETRKIVLTR